MLAMVERWKVELDKEFWVKYFLNLRILDTTFKMFHFNLKVFNVSFKPHSFR